MKLILRCISILVLVLMLVGTVAACNNKEEEPNTATADDTEVTSAETPELANDHDELPDDLDLKGRAITIHSRVQTVAAGEFFQDSLDGGIVSEAVYKRNKAVEDRLNCRIVNDEVVGDTNNGDMYTTAEAMIVSGGATYQILVTASYRMCPLAYNGLLGDITELEYIDLEKDYYSQGYNDALSVGQAQYLATGPFSLGYYRYLTVNYFNKKMFSDAQVEDPFELVREGKWTLERMNEIAKKFASDSGTESGKKDAGDMFGYAIPAGSGASNTDGFMSACDLHVLVKGPDNYYEVDIDQGRFSTAVDRVIELLNGEGTFATTGNDLYLAVSLFSDGHAAMHTNRLFAVEDPTWIALGDTDGYGILPLPMADEYQEDYVSYVQDQCFLYGFPTTLTGEDLTQVSQFFEAFACESYNSVRKTYYDVAISTRYLDTDSSEMLDLMARTVYVDPINVYLTNGFRTFSAYALRDIYASGQNTVSSLFASSINKGALKEEVNNMNNYYKDIYARNNAS